jgi:hypothetical protein
MQNRFGKLLLILATLGQFALAQASSTPATSTPDSHSVPSLDGGLGPCTADFLITDTDSKPVYNAKVKVHIAYGFMNVRKLDLEVDTNFDGKARFTGLPNNLKHGIYFRASEGDRGGEVFDDPAQTCQKQFAITLRKGDQPAQQ